jgi:ABC-2 type transport system ATP-binding protein
MTNGAARFVNVSKRFGSYDALSGLTLDVPRGSVVGLLGRNGAGKSTALRCLVGLQVPDSGEVRVLDSDPVNLSIGVRQRIGFQAEQGVPFLEVKVAKLIRFCAPLYPNWDRELEAQLLSRFGIDPNRPLSQHSQGQQRAVVAVAGDLPAPRAVDPRRTGGQPGRGRAPRLPGRGHGARGGGGEDGDLFQPHPV